MFGVDKNGNIQKLNITPNDSICKNYAFDITPSKYISKIITEKKNVDANEQSINSLK